MRDRDATSEAVLRSVCTLLCSYSEPWWIAGGGPLTFIARSRSPAYAVWFWKCISGQ